MVYNFLSKNLHETAEQLILFLNNNFGISKVNIEQSIYQNIDIKPTLSGQSPRGYIICIEISDSPYPPTLDRFILDCRANDIPVKVYVANPSSKKGTVDEKMVRRLSSQGIGYIIVENHRVEIILDALELSLYLPEPSYRFTPKGLRAAIRDAYSTYKNGDPVKGVASICDEIELIIRKLAKKGKKKGTIPTTCRLNFDKSRLSNVIDNLKKYEIFNGNQFAKSSVFREIRNDTSHPPKNFRLRMERQIKLKTNFNWVIDYLNEVRKIPLK